MKKGMLAIMAMFILMAMLIGLVGCRQTSSPESDPTERSTDGTQGEAVKEEATGELTLLSTGGKHCSTDNGYYYLTETPTELEDGSYAKHLLYMDYATQQEIYLCSNAGCNHTSLDCPAVFSCDEIGYDSCLFCYEGYLYLLSKDHDNDGSFAVDMMNGTGESVPEESTAATLYRMNPDGTDRVKVFVFNAGLTLENVVIGGEKALYMITKETSAEQVGAGGTYTTSSNRRLIKLSTDSWELSDVCSLNPDETSTNWKVLGCYDDRLVLTRTAYDHALSSEEYMDDEAFRECYARSQTQFAVMSLVDCSPEVVYTVSNSSLRSYAQWDGALYVSSEDEKDIKMVSLRTGEESTLAELDCNYIQAAYGDALCCSTWDSASDHSLYFVSYDGGSVRQCSLVNRELGWPLEIMGETADKYLVIYDYEATPHGDGSYEITQYQYALISKEDLYESIDSYQPIQMVGVGR